MKAMAIQDNSRYPARELSAVASSPVLFDRGTGLQCNHEPDAYERVINTSITSRVVYVTAWLHQVRSRDRNVLLPRETGGALPASHISRRRSIFLATCSIPKANHIPSLFFSLLQFDSPSFLPTKSLFLLSRLAPAIGFGFRRT